MANSARRRRNGLAKPDSGSDRQMNLDKRRAETWHLYVHESLSVRQIAEKQNRSTARVHDDLKAVKDHTPEHDKAIISLRRLEQVDELVSCMMKEARYGDSSAVNSIVKLLDREAKYLGLDAETRKDIKEAVVYKILGLSNED